MTDDLPGLFVDTITLSNFALAGRLDILIKRFDARLLVTLEVRERGQRWHHRRISRAARNRNRDNRERIQQGESADRRGTGDVPGAAANDGTRRSLLYSLGSVPRGGIVVTDGQDGEGGLHRARSCLHGHDRHSESLLCRRDARALRSRRHFARHDLHRLLFASEDHQ